MFKFGMLIVCGVGAGLAQAQSLQDCELLARAESDAVIRDFSARSPGQGAGAAQQAWAKGLHDALQAVQQRHEACRGANRSITSEPQLQRMQACLETNRRQSDALNQRFQGRVLSFQEQTELRSEQDRLHSAQLACSPKR